MFKKHIFVQNIPGKISFGQDCWTAANGGSFMGIRAHWISADRKKQNMLLDFVPLEESHTGVNLCESFLSSLQEFGISIDKIMCITADNAPNNDTFLREVIRKARDAGVNLDEAICRERCRAHVFNLSAQVLLVTIGCAPPQDEENPNVIENISYTFSSTPESLVKKLRLLVRKISRCASKKSELRNLCDQHKIPKLNLSPDVSTRWNSTYLMIERAKKLKQPLMELCAKHRDLHNLMMTEKDWEDLTEVIKLLKKFNDATNVVSSAQKPNGPAIIPTSEWLESSIKKFIKDSSGTLKSAAQAALSKLQEYRPTTDGNNSAILSVVLNPALKLNYFKEHKWDSRNIKSIRDFAVKYFKENYMGLVDSTEEPTEDSEDDEDGLFAFMNKRKRMPPSSQTEMQKYLNEPLADVGVDVLKWWELQSVTYPTLSIMATDFLSIQASSVDNERDFSGGVDLLPPTRRRLKKDAIRACMCLKSWLQDSYEFDVLQEDGCTD